MGVNSSLIECYFCAESVKIQYAAIVMVSTCCQVEGVNKV